MAEIPVTVAAGQLKHRPLPFHGHATLKEDRAAGTVTATMTVDGPSGKALGFQIFPDKYKAFSNTPVTVPAGGSRPYTWDATATDGRYAFTIYGNDGFVRSFAGQLVPTSQRDLGIPHVQAELVKVGIPTLRLTLGDDGKEPVRYQLTANEFAGGTKTVHVAAGKTVEVDWPAQDGYYDVTITADTGTGWTQRYAGRIATA
jgi:phospholipase C